MKHRHLNHDNLTLAAIDSIIERGTWRDWRRLARAMRYEAGIAEKVQKLAAARLGNRRDEEVDRKLFARWHKLAVRLDNRNKVEEYADTWTALYQYDKD